jgi:hypothetical protein
MSGVVWQSLFVSWLVVFLGAIGLLLVFQFVYFMYNVGVNIDTTSCLPTLSIYYLMPRSLYCEDYAA